MRGEREGGMEGNAGGVGKKEGDENNVSGKLGRECPGHKVIKHHITGRFPSHLSFLPHHRLPLLNRETKHETYGEARKGDGGEAMKGDGEEAGERGKERR